MKIDKTIKTTTQYNKLSCKFISYCFIDKLILNYLLFDVTLQIKLAFKVAFHKIHMRKIILITGGQRSGKSVYAEKLALSLSKTPYYIATAHIWDEEFNERVKKHKERRGPQWTNIEEEKYLSKHNISGQTAVIDCITLWCTNFFFNNNEGPQPTVDEALNEIKQEFDKFVNQDATFIFVTNEIGSGEVSNNAVQRRFTDLQGWMNQYVASRSDEVIMMVCGIPVKIK